MAKIWIQDWGTYGEQTLICLGVTKAEILTHLKSKKVKGNANFISVVEEKFEIPERCDGLFWYIPKARGSILWLLKFEWTADCIGVLVHEVTHAVRRLLIEERNMVSEIEAICYQTEYLTKNILLEAQK